MTASATTEKLRSLPVARDLPADVVRVYGDLHGKLDGDLIALGGSGAEILTVEDGGVLRRFDLLTGHQLSALSMSELESCWAFSHDGRFLASGGLDLSISEAADGEQIAAIAAPAWISCIAFDPDGAFLATGHDDGAVRIWSAQSGKLLWTLERHQSEICALAFSPDGRRLATAGEDRVVVIWNLESGQRELEMVGHTDRVEALAWSQSCEVLASASWDTSVRLWNASTGELTAMLNGQGEKVHCVAFTPDDTALACGDSDGVVRIWDHRRLTVIDELRAHRADVRHLRICEGGKRIVSGGLERTIVFWNRESKEVWPDPAAASTGVAAIALSSDEELILVHEGGSLAIWDFETALKLESPECPPVTAVAADGGGNWATGHRDGSVTYYPVGEERSEARWQAHPSPINHLALQPMGKLLASAAGSDDTVHLWNPETGEPVLIIPHAVEECGVEALAFHPNRELLAIGGVDWLAVGEREGAIAVWNWRSRSKEVVLPGAARRLAFSRNGELLAALGVDGAVLIWNFLAATLVTEIAVPGTAIVALAFDESGSRLAVGCQDGGLRIWSTANWRMMNAIDLETQPQALLFAGDGSAVLTGNANACCYLVNV